MAPAPAPSGHVRSGPRRPPHTTVLCPQVPPPPGHRGVCRERGAGRQRPRDCRSEVALTLNSGPLACVCVRARVATRVFECVSRGVGAGLEAAANHCPRGAEPSAPPSRRQRELRAPKPFMILVTLFQEWAGGAGPPGAEPRPRPYKYGFLGSLWGRELGGEPRAPSALPTLLAVGLSPGGGPANAQCPHSAACRACLRP